jgi:two-component system sensor histidine kinase GlrK
VLKATLRFSFPQLLLVAFVLIGALLGAAAVRTLFSLDTIMAQSRESTTQAIALSTAAQSLSERSLTMERAARQALVLGDRQLRQRFEEAAGHARDILRRLESNELPPEFSRQWLQQLSDVEALLDGSPETALDRERAVARAFRELDGHSAAIAQQVQAIIGNRNDALQDRVEKSRRQLTQQVLGSIALAAVMALGFGVWLARPFQRLEKAIVGLGENRLDLPIDIPGPPDVRRVSQQLEWLRLRLTELDADKARFLRHVSHELKTPLASLHEGVAVLGDGVAGPLSPSQAEVVSILQHNTQLLQHQIEALLRFNAAAFEARQLRREPTDLLALVEEQIETQRLRWQSHQLSVRAEGP